MLDVDNKNAVFCHSANKLTSRTSGITIDKYRDTDVYYLISKCLFNLPLTMIYISFFFKQEKTFKNKTAKHALDEYLETGKKQHKYTVEEIKEEKYMFLTIAIIYPTKTDL